MRDLLKIVSICIIVIGAIGFVFGFVSGAAVNSLSGGGIANKTTMHLFLTIAVQTGLLGVLPIAVGTFIYGISVRMEGRRSDGVFLQNLAAFAALLVVLLGAGHELEQNYTLNKKAEEFLSLLQEHNETPTDYLLRTTPANKPLVFATELYIAEYEKIATGVSSDTYPVEIDNKGLECLKYLNANGPFGSIEIDPKDLQIRIWSHVFTSKELAINYIKKDGQKYAFPGKYSRDSCSLSFLTKEQKRKLLPFQHQLVKPVSPSVKPKPKKAPQATAKKPDPVWTPRSTITSTSDLNDNDWKIIEAMRTGRLNRSDSVFASRRFGGNSRINACRGTGVSVCIEKVKHNPNFFKDNPHCVANSNCQGSYFRCNLICSKGIETN